MPSAGLFLSAFGQTELLSDVLIYGVGLFISNLLLKLSGKLLAPMSTTGENGLPSVQPGGLDIDNNLQPAYLRSPQVARKPIKTKDFLYTLLSRGKPWAILILTANESFSKNIPTFVEGSTVKGTVKLSLDRPEYIYSVYITVCPYAQILLQGVHLQVSSSISCLD